MKKIGYADYRSHHPDAIIASADFTPLGARWSNVRSAESTIALDCSLTMQRFVGWGSALESSLYLPVKRFLEDCGFVVKGEVGGCDLLALKGSESPLVVIGELKLSFNLELILQAVDRAAASDEVWIAAKLSARGKGREGDARFRNLCRRLGFGMLGVSPSGEVSIIVSPISPMPRKDAGRRSQLVGEHRKRIGDPAVGGGSRQPIMTAYRQRALACAAALANGVSRPRDLRPIAADAPSILRRDVYGWFRRLKRGAYALTEDGEKALARWPQSPCAIYGVVKPIASVATVGQISVAQSVRLRAK